MVTRKLFITSPFLSLFLLLVLPGSMFALDIGTSVRFGNIGFAPERTSTDLSFNGEQYFWGVSAFGTQNITDNFVLEAGFFEDQILRNISYTLFSYKESFFKLGVGPFFGFFNTANTLLKAGISTSVMLELPGYVFLTFRSENTIGGRLVETGDYLQERSDVAFGYYVSNAICSLNLLSRRYTQKTSIGENVDSKTEYSFKTEIFQKNVPYRVLLSFGYVQLSKTFYETVTTKHTIGSLVVGTKVNMDITNFLNIVVDLESSIYTFGLDALLAHVSNPGPGGYMFNAAIEAVLKTDKIVQAAE